MCKEEKVVDLPPIHMFIKMDVMATRLIISINIIEIKIVAQPRKKYLSRGSVTPTHAPQSVSLGHQIQACLEILIVMINVRVTMNYMNLSTVIIMEFARANMEFLHMILKTRVVQVLRV